MSDLAFQKQLAIGIRVQHRLHLGGAGVTGSMGFGASYAASCAGACFSGSAGASSRIGERSEPRRSAGWCCAGVAVESRDTAVGAGGERGWGASPETAEL